MHYCIIIVTFVQKKSENILSLFWRQNWQLKKTKNLRKLKAFFMIFIYIYDILYMLNGTVPMKAGDLLVLLNPSSCCRPNLNISNKLSWICKHETMSLEYSTITHCKTSWTENSHRKGIIQLQNKVKYTGICSDQFGAWMSYRIQSNARLPYFWVFKMHPFLIPCSHIHIYTFLPPPCRLYSDEKQQSLLQSSVLQCSL